MPTTIQLNEETKDMISTFGTKKDTFDTILVRIKNSLESYYSLQKILFP